MSFVNTSAIKVIFYLQAQVMFYVYFLHSLTDYGKIWYKISAHNVQPRRFQETGTGKATLFSRAYMKLYIYVYTEPLFCTVLVSLK